MSGAGATVSAAPPVAGPAMTPPIAAPQTPESAGQPDSNQSFTEVLSAQRAASRHDEGTHQDADNKRGSSHGTKEATAHGSPRSSLTAARSLPTGSPAEAPVTGLADSVAVAADPVGGVAPADGSTAAPEEAPDDGGPGHPIERGAPVRATTPQPTDPSTTTTASPDPRAPEAAGAAPDAAGAVPDAAVAATIGQAVPRGTSKDDADESAGPSASGDATSAGSGATAPAAVKSPSDAAHVAAPLHNGPAATLAADRATPAPVDATSVAAATPTTAPVAHLENQGAAVQSEALRAAPSVLRVGESTAPAASTLAQSGAPALDVDGLSTSISRPLSDGNGTYTVTVALHPSELGHLQAVLSLAGNDLQVSLTAQTQAGHDALTNATDALKDQLGRGGVNVNVTLRDPGSPSGGEERDRPPSMAGAGSLLPGSSAPEPSVPSGLVAGQIHLVL